MRGFSNFKLQFQSTDHKQPAAMFWAKQGL